MPALATPFWAAFDGIVTAEMSPATGRPVTGSVLPVRVGRVLVPTVALPMVPAVSLPSRNPAGWLASTTRYVPGRRPVNVYAPVAVVTLAAKALPCASVPIRFSVTFWPATSVSPWAALNTPSLLASE